MPKLFALALLVLTPLGCSGKDATVLDWDLSESHTTADIGRAGDGGGGFDDVEAVRVQLPERRSFEATSDLRRVAFFATKGQLRHLTVVFEPQIAEDAYERVHGFIEAWGLTQHDRVEEWYAQARGVTGPEAAEVNTSQVFAQAPGEMDDVRIGSDGPAVGVLIVYSFNDERPFAVHFELNW